MERITADEVVIHARVLEDDRMARNVRLTFKSENGGTVSRLLKDAYEDFENMPLGPYRLTVMQNAEEKGVYAFVIDDDGIFET